MSVSLSAREIQVLKGFGDGYSVSEIAGRLGLSVKTVSTYRTRLIDKLIGLEIERATTAALVRYAITSGVVT